MSALPSPMTGNYPIILSDALLGRRSKEVLTGIKYNTPPPPPATTTSALLKPSTSDLSKYNLTLSTPSSTSFYHGSRTDGATRGQGKYVLVFDDQRQAFILHQLDSQFDMTFVRSSDASAPAPTKPPAPAVTQPPKGRKKAAAAAAPKEKEKAPEPAPKKQKAAAGASRKRREPSPVESEDSDDGLTIEYPGGKPPKRATPVGRGTLLFRGPQEDEGYRPRSPDLSFAEQRQGQESEESEEDGDGDVDPFDLGSPVGHGNARHDPESGEEGEEEDLDLEAELERELERQAGGGEESSESEEE